MLQRMVSGVVLAWGLVLAGCASVDGGPTAKPQSYLSGVHQHTYLYKAPFLFDRNYPDVRMTYNGQWQDNMPKGPGGGMFTSYGYSCGGEFGVDPGPGEKKIGAGGSSNEPYVWGKGGVLVNNQLVYQGYFRSDPIFAEGCQPFGRGAWLGKDFTVAGRFETELNTRNRQGRVYVWVKMEIGDCTISYKDGRTYQGRCSSPKSEAAHEMFVISDMDLKDPLVLLNGKGVYTDAQGTRYEGEFARSGRLNGLFRITHKGLDSRLAFLQDGRLLAEHPAPEFITKNGTPCGPWKDFYVLNRNECRAGQWNGQVTAYSADGLWRLAGSFQSNQPRGEVTYFSLPDLHEIKGSMAMQNRTPQFVRARVSKMGEVVYNGEMKGFTWHGNGLCRYEGQMEECKLVDGQRVDTLYKTRIENERLRREMQGANERRRQEAEQQARAAQLQSAPAQQSSGFQWGKATALLGGAAIGGLDKLPADTQAKVIAGALQDSMAGQSGVSNFQQSVAGGSGTGVGSGSSSGSGSGSGGVAMKGGVPKATFDAGELACQKEADANARPYGDSQLDTFCVLASSNACVKRKFNYTGYEAERQASCRSMMATARALNLDPNKCGACP